MTKIAMTNLYIYNQNEPLFDYDQRKNKHKNIRKTTVDIMSADWLEEPELTDFETPEALYVKQEMLQALNVALEQLTEEERQILIYMFGLREEPKLQNLSFGYLSIKRFSHLIIMHHVAA